MPTKREYLFSKGLTKAPVGRGRFSAEAHAELAKATASGMTFSDVESVPAKVSAPKSVKPAKAPTDRDVMTEAPRRYPEGTTFTGSYTYKGKPHTVTVNDKQACSCGMSLSHHRCLTPTAVVGPGVRISVKASSGVIA